jgi:hypothetical protein
MGTCAIFLQEQDGEATEAGFGCVRVVAKEALFPCLPCAQSNKPHRSPDRNLDAMEAGWSVRPSVRDG